MTPPELNTDLKYTAPRLDKQALIEINKIVSIMDNAGYDQFDINVTTDCDNMVKIYFICGAEYIDLATEQADALCQWLERYYEDVESHPFSNTQLIYMLKKTEGSVDWNLTADVVEEFQQQDTSEYEYEGEEVSATYPIYPVVLEFMKAHQIGSLICRFQGGGDDGTVEHVDYFDKDDNLIEPDVNDPGFSEGIPHLNSQSFEETLIDMAMRIAYNELPNWQGNDGGEGFIKIFQGGKMEAEVNLFSVGLRSAPINNTHVLPLPIRSSRRSPMENSESAQELN